MSETEPRWVPPYENSDRPITPGDEATGTSFDDHGDTCRVRGVVASVHVEMLGGTPWTVVLIRDGDGHLFDCGNVRLLEVGADE